MSDHLFPRAWRPGAAVVPVEWRASAPSLAEVAAHEARGGWWWLAGRMCPPVADCLTTGDDGEGAEAFVWSSGDARRHAALTWDEYGGDEWRGTALVCPCDADGAPVAWP